MKMIICRGVSASGKSTFAKELCEEDSSFVEINRDWIRFNVISPGGDWGSYKFSNKKEREVTEIQKEMTMDAYAKEKNIVLSDTNLSNKTLQMWLNIAGDLGYDVEIKYFHITFEEAVRRDNLRANGVGQAVIYKQWLKWLEIIERKKYVPDTSLPEAVLFDVDGCLANNTSGRGWYEWDKVGQDTPHKHIVELAQMYYSAGTKVILLSGRDSVCRDITANWMRKHCVPFDELFMREQGCHRKDVEIKEEIFWKHIAPRYNVKLVVDDRACVARNWNEMGLNVLTHGNWGIEF
jgi:predicted kinase